jgi:glycosyltransferase involved in cell wall biosynthesis
MDAGVLQQAVLPHDANQHRAMLLAKGEKVIPTLTADLPIARSGAVSLVVPTFFNRSLKNGSLGHLLAGIERSRAVEEVVLVVADGAEDAEASPAPLPGGKRLVFAACEPNRRSRSRNVGAEAASRDILLFLDDDMLPRDWRGIDVVVSAMIGGGFDCALFPRRNYARFPLLYRGDDLGRFIARWRAGEVGLDDPAFIDPVHQGSPYKMMTFCFPGCFTLIRREAYRRIGGFPSDYEGWGFEDAVFAMRAVTSLKVLNLFRKGEPLLHIDHPVSPYKTEEYQANLRRFNASYNPLDMDWLCRRIFSGEDFSGQRGDGPDASAYFEPLERVAEACHLPLVMDEVARNYRAVVQKRLELGCDPVPDTILLHGSRGNGTSAAGSDFDLLLLYRGGAFPEYFVCRREGAPRVEIEFSDFGRLEDIATRPVFHPLFGPFELAKVAQGLLLWGDADLWDGWSDWLLRTALQHGRIPWLLYAMSLRLQPEKVGALGERFLGALRVLLERVDAARYGEDLARLADARPGPLGAHVRAALDAEIPGWRADVAEGRRAFAFQVPELWTALRWVLEGA